MKSGNWCTLDLQTELKIEIPEQKRDLLDDVVTKLSQVKNITAIVLGGSYASGTQNEESDLDLGLYYDPTEPFAIDDIRKVAHMISANEEPTVTDFYEWGSWVNGGAWIQTAAGKVDFVYRNIDRVQMTIDEAREGITHHDYD